MFDYSNSPIFKQYSSSSNEITLYYQLMNYFPQFKNGGLHAYKNEFGSNVNKENFRGLITISKWSTLRNLKIEISKKTGFPLNTMVSFGYWGGEYYDESGVKWEKVIYYIINENIFISNNYYNNSIITNRYIYIFIDIGRDEIFSGINKNQIINDKKIEELEKNEKESKVKITNLELMMNNLNFENNQNRKKISNITNENIRLTENINKVQEERRKHEKDSKNCCDKFKIEKNKIKYKISQFCL